MSTPTQTWQMPKPAAAGRGTMPAAGLSSNSNSVNGPAGGAAAGGGGGNGGGVSTLASLYPQVVHDPVADAAAGNLAAVPRVSALAGFSTAARKSQQATEIIQQQRGLTATTTASTGPKSAAPGGGAIPPTVTYPASSLLLGSSTPASASSASSSAATAAPARSPLPVLGSTTTAAAPSLQYSQSTLPQPSKFAVASHVPFSPATSGAGGGGSGGGGAGGNGATPQLATSSSFAGTASLLAGTTSSLQHASLFAGGSGGVGGGLAQPAGALGHAASLTSHRGVAGVGAAGSGSGLTSPLPPSFVADALQRQAHQARLEQQQQQKVSLDVGQALNALTCSPDRTHLAVGGKEVKIISYSAGKPFKVEQSTNSKTPTALSDIQWHPLEAFSHWLVAAPTNGKILLYNLLSKDSLRRCERTLDDHERTVNRIVWHPTQGEILFSGSQDGTVKMFDLRTPSTKAAQSFADAHSVRDVQVNPFNNNVFSASYENGSIQIWDVRKGSYFHTINAHQGLILTLDWHPEDKDILASGGVDRAIKVWHIGASTANTLGIHSTSASSSISSSLSSANGGGSHNSNGSNATNQTEPLHTIQTIASVGRVRWRPSPRFPFQLASAANLMDCKIHIWNVHRPFVPMVSLLGHKDVVTGFFFADAAGGTHGAGGGGGGALNEAHSLASEIISCSKDSTIQKNFLFIDHALHPNYHLTSYPAEQLRTSGIAWNIQGNIATVNDAIDRRNNIMQPDAVLPGPFSFLAHNPALLSSTTLAGTSSASTAGASAASTPSSSAHSTLKGSTGAALQQAVLMSMMAATRPGLAATGQPDPLRNGFIRIFNGSAPTGDAQQTSQQQQQQLLSPEEAFVYFARNYKFTPKTDFSSSSAAADSTALQSSSDPSTSAAPSTFTTLCLHNSSVARSASQFELGQIWLVLSQLLGPGVRRVEAAPSTAPPPLPMDDPPPPQNSSVSGGGGANSTGGGAGGRKITDAATAALAAANAAANANAGFRPHTTTYVPPQTFNSSTVNMRRAYSTSLGLQPSTSDGVTPAPAASASSDAFSQQYLQIELVNAATANADLSPDAQAQQVQAQFPYAKPAHHQQHQTRLETHDSGLFSPTAASLASSPPSALLSPATAAAVVVAAVAGDANSLLPPQHRPPPISVPDPAQTISALNRSHILLDCLPTIHKSHCYTLQNPAYYEDDIASRVLGAAMQQQQLQQQPPPQPYLPNPYNSSLSSLSSPRFHATLLNAYLESAIERGDVQTCVCIVSLLKEFHPHVLLEMERAEKEAEQIGGGGGGSMIGGGSNMLRSALRSPPSAPTGHSLADRQKQWYWSYIDLLQRHELYSCASEIIQLCGDADLKKINQKSTTISLICPVCKHASQQVGVGCTSKSCTKTRMTNCAICQLTVSGVWVWCQGCGHGGHMDHMQAWFGQHSFCPTGCLHRCVELVTGSSNNQK